MWNIGLEHWNSRCCFVEQDIVITVQFYVRSLTSSYLITSMQDEDVHSLISLCFELYGYCLDMFILGTPGLLSILSILSTSFGSRSQQSLLSLKGHSFCVIIEPITILPSVLISHHLIPVTKTGQFAITSSIIYIVVSFWYIKNNSYFLLSAICECHALLNECVCVISFLSHQARTQKYIKQQR